MRREITPNGNLVIVATNQDRKYLSALYRAPMSYYGAESLVAEAFHEDLTFIRPSAIGALTSAPILTDDADYAEEAMERGGPVPYDDAHVWWYPNYAVSDPWEVLKNTGRVVFTLATVQP